MFLNKGLTMNILQHLLCLTEARERTGELFKHKLPQIQSWIIWILTLCIKDYKGLICTFVCVFRYMFAVISMFSWGGVHIT